MSSEGSRKTHASGTVNANRHRGSDRSSAPVIPQIGVRMLPLDTLRRGLMNNHQRQCERERRASFQTAAGGRDGPPVKFGQLLRDRQTQPQAAMLPRETGIGLAEPLEDEPKKVWRYSSEFTRQKAYPSAPNRSRAKSIAFQATESVSVDPRIEPTRALFRFVDAPRCSARFSTHRQRCHPRRGSLLTIASSEDSTMAASVSVGSGGRMVIAGG